MEAPAWALLICSAVGDRLDELAWRREGEPTNVKARKAAKTAKTETKKVKKGRSAQQEGREESEEGH